MKSSCISSNVHSYPIPMTVWLMTAGDCRCSQSAIRSYNSRAYCLGPKGHPKLANLGLFLNRLLTTAFDGAILLDIQIAYCIIVHMQSDYLSMNISANHGGILQAILLDNSQLLGVTNKMEVVRWVCMSLCGIGGCPYPIHLGIIEH